MAGVFYWSQIMAQIPFEKLKVDERQWAVEGAATTLKEYAKLKRKENKPLLKAARQYLEDEISDSKKTLKETT
jgi:hypothetical protein